MYTISFWADGEMTDPVEAADFNDSTVEALAKAQGIWDGSENFPQFDVADETGEWVAGG